LASERSDGDHGEHYCQTAMDPNALAGSWEANQENNVNNCTPID
jgi:hypothetical protein